MQTSRSKRKLILVAGARPNFMKIAPLMQALKNHQTIQPVLVHTGQHYDEQMSDLFFKQLEIPKPEINLEVGSASHAVQTARIMERFEQVCNEVKPGMVLVVGDVNSTVACTLVPAKLGVKTAHYEAGLRSRDKSMPEEINRIVTDSICDYFFTTSRDADENLILEGKKTEQIFRVGNLMIDTLLKWHDRLHDISLQLQPIQNGRVIDFSASYRDREFGVLTFHRPANVDDVQNLKSLLNALCNISRDVPLIFPIHPRTQASIQKHGLLSFVEEFQNLSLVKPTGYLEFIKMVKEAKFVITDSGGIQEETTVLGKPCLTVRPNTERPITILQGTNKLIQIQDIESEVADILAGRGKTGQVPPLWDGKSAGRIVDHLTKIVA